MRATRPLPIAFLAAAAVTLAVLPGVAAASPSDSAPSPSSATSKTAKAAVVKVKGWTRLSSGKISILTQPHALPLDGGGTQVIWYQEDGPNSDSIRARVVLENGKPGTGIVPVVTGWATLVDDPKVIENGASRMAVFAGIRSTSPGEKFNGPMAYATSGNGTTWTLGTGSLTHTGSAYASYGTAAVDDAGTPFVAVNASSSSFVTLHRGVDPSVPAAAPDWTTTASTSGYSLHAGLGIDSKTGDGWAVWYCLGCSKSQDGVLAQRVWPKPIGALKHGPKSSTKGQSLNPQQGVAVASRKGGGVWAAYKVGYPVANKIRLWHVGTKEGFNVKTKDADHISLLAGPGGRLWLVWDSVGGSKVKAARTNKKVTRLGLVRTFNPPKKSGSYSSVWATSGSGSGGPLHLLINAQMGSGATQIWYRKVLPGLRLVVKPKKLNYGTITATVTDAGKAVSGAKVTFRGATKTTKAKGAVTFKVGKGVASGKYKLTAKKSGYEKGLASVKVT